MTLDKFNKLNQAAKASFIAEYGKKNPGCFNMQDDGRLSIDPQMAGYLISYSGLRSKKARIRNKRLKRIITQAIRLGIGASQ